MKALKDKHYRALSRSWRAERFWALKREACRIEVPKKHYRFDFCGPALCIAALGLIGLLFVPWPREALAPISSRPIEGNHYFNPPLGSVHQIQVPGLAGWTFITFKGILKRLGQLPSDPAPGDTYYVCQGGGYWVWAYPGGTGRWLDP